MKTLRTRQMRVRLVTKSGGDQTNITEHDQLGVVSYPGLIESYEGFSLANCVKFKLIY